MAGKQAFLPMSQTDAQGGATSVGGGMRRRLSSISLHLKIQSSSMSAATWGLRRSKSAASMGEHAASSIRKWWDWGWAWIQFRKPVVGSDLEMSEDDHHRRYNNKETYNNHPISSSLKNVFLKVRKEFRRLAGGNDRVGLPQTYKYDSFNYAKNFDR